jgi:osmotically-inducible protein OsmY
MRTDPEILKEVIHLLELDPALDTSHITAEVKGGIVTLRGLVHALPEKWMTKNAIRHISGVKDVIEELTVSPFSDQEKQYKALFQDESKIRGETYKMIPKKV